MKKMSDNKIIIALGALLIAILLAVLFFSSRNYKKNNNDNNLCVKDMNYFYDCMEKEMNGKGDNMECEGKVGRELYLEIKEEQLKDALKFKKDFESDKSISNFYDIDILTRDDIKDCIKTSHKRRISMEEKSALKELRKLSNEERKKNNINSEKIKKIYNNMINKLEKKYNIDLKLDKKSKYVLYFSFLNHDRKIENTSRKSFEYTDAFKYLMNKNNLKNNEGTPFADSELIQKIIWGNMEESENYRKFIEKTNFEIERRVNTDDSWFEKNKESNALNIINKKDEKNNIEDGTIDLVDDGYNPNDKINEESIPAIPGLEKQYEKQKNNNGSIDIIDKRTYYPKNKRSIEIAIKNNSNETVQLFSKEVVMARFFSSTKESSEMYCNEIGHGNEKILDPKEEIVLRFKCQYNFTSDEKDDGYIKIIKNGETKIIPFKHKFNQIEKIGIVSA